MNPEDHGRMWADLGSRENRLLYLRNHWPLLVADIERQAGADRCPPHRFEAAWSSGDDNKGVIFCRYCGDIRELLAQDIAAPAEESTISVGFDVADD